MCKGIYADHAGNYHLGDEAIALTSPRGLAEVNVGSD